MTDILEGDKYVTLHFVWTSFLDISDILKETLEDEVHEADGTFSITNEMKKIGREYYMKNEKDMTPSFEHKVMTFLTPHYKKLNFIEARDKYTLCAKIESYLNIHFPENDINRNAPNVLTNDQSIQNTSTPGTIYPSNF